MKEIKKVLGHIVLMQLLVTVMVVDHLVYQD